MSFARKALKSVSFVLNKFSQIANIELPWYSEVSSLAYECEAKPSEREPLGTHVRSFECADPIRNNRPFATMCYMTYPPLNVILGTL